MSLLLQGGSANIADVQFEGGAGNKTVVIPKEGGKLAVGTMLSGATAYHLLQGDLSVSNEVITNGFSTTLYTSGSATTGVDMSTQHGNDASETFGGLVWLKDIAEATNNFLYDTIRGATKEINSNTTEAEATLAGGLTAFNSTGFTVGADAGHNSTTNNMVSWNFQTTHRRTGTTNHGKAFTEHYNPFTGFTIIKYEGSGLAGHEIPHSLGRKLGFVTVKATNTTGSWIAGGHITGGGFLLLNSAQAFTPQSGAGTYFRPEQNTELSIVVDDAGITNKANISANQYILYGWANSYFDESNKLIGNYEIGTYGGTGAAGNKVVTRGKPAWVMIKRMDSNGSWAIFDNQRTTSKFLLANSSAVEGLSQPLGLFTETGFTINNAAWSDINASGGQYFYMVVYDNDSGSGKSKYPRATDSSQLSINNAIIPFAQGIDSNGTKVSTLSKNESITGLTYTSGKNYVYAKVDGTYGVTKYKPRYLESDLIAEKAVDNPDYFDVLSNTWYSTNANPELITNGDGNSVTGWLNDTGTLSVENGSIKCTSSAINTGYTYQTVNTSIGKTYRMKGTITNVNMYQYGLLISDSVNTLFAETITSTGRKTYDITFVAQSTTTNIKFFRNSSAASQYIYIDGVSVYASDLELNVPITARNYLDIIAYADASGQLTYVEELVKTQYFDRIETSGNRKVMYLADYGIVQIQNNKRYVLDNPFGNDRFMDCDTKLEIYDSVISKWIEVGHSVPDNGSGAAFYGAKSFSTLDGLIIQTATNSILYAGASGLVQPYSASSSLTSAPARVTIQFSGKTGRTR